jgi:hypothetical protein
MPVSGTPTTPDSATSPAPSSPWSRAPRRTTAACSNLRDERRLPFEGAGAISNWRIELPNGVPQFDPETISDVVLHLRYTAREAGNLEADAVQHLHDDVLQDPQHLAQLFSLNHDFPDVWRPFVNAMDDDHRTMTLQVNKDYFPYWVKPLGMADQIVATFAVTHATKHKLSLAPAALPFVGDATNGWTLTVDQASPVFAFLKKWRTQTVYVTISYMGIA